jgi:hypothetical protein
LLCQFFSRQKIDAQGRDFSEKFQLELGALVAIMLHEIPSFCADVSLV